MTALLDIHGLTVSYGGLVAVDDVTLSVPERGIVGLIGPNGAGKTSLIDAISGFTPTAQGHVALCGHALDDLPAHRRARAGLTRTFQSVELFDDLSVHENVLVAACPPRWWSPVVDVVLPNRRRAIDVAWALAAVGVQDDADTMPHALPVGRRRLAGLARALAARPRLVLLDEPAAGLDTAETAALAARLRGLPDSGIGILLVDHDMSLVLSVCDTVYVLDFGRVIASGTPAEIRDDPAVIRAYLGETHSGGGAT